MKWQKEKPDYACVFLTRHKDSNNEFYYNLWRFEWAVGEGEPITEDYDEYTKFYYLAWCNGDGDEWDDIADCDFDDYLVLQRLKTLEEIE